MKSLISVVTPQYNRELLIKQTFQSLVNQSYPVWEWIVVDDNSSEDSIRYLEEIIGSESRVKLFRRHRKPRGAPTCRNIGIEHVVGELVVFLDSDDLLSPHCLEQRVKVMEQNPHLDFAVFPMLLFTNQTSEAKYLWNVDTREDDLSRFLRLDAVWQTSGLIWRKSALEKIGGFTEGLACWQDVDLHLKALFHKLSYKKFYHYAPDCFYRKHNQGSVSQERINTPEKLRSRWKIYLAVMEHIEKSTEKKDLLRAIKHMIYGIMLSALKVNNFRFLFLLLLNRRVVSVTGVIFYAEVMQAIIEKILIKLKLKSFSPVMEKLNLKYILPSIIGTVEYDPTFDFNSNSR